MANMEIRCKVENGVLHFEVYDIRTGQFVVSADTESEARAELYSLVNR